MTRLPVAQEDPTVVLKRLKGGRTVTEQELIPDNHKAILNAIIDKDPRYRVDPDTADNMAVEDWVVRFKEELRTVSNSSDEVEVFRALHQIRYLATQALFAHVRNDMRSMEQAS